MAVAAPPASLFAHSPVPHRAVERRYVVAVIGNPNTGKTTLFNALTGLTQHTGNYPGVTVESAIGEFTVEGAHFSAVDLPGTYSLAPRAPDEMIAVKVLLGLGQGVHAPDVVLCVLDATNLDRNLYLLTQVLDIGRPVVIALTMSDLAQKQGIVIDLSELAKRLGVPVVPVQANRRIGLPALRQALGRAVRDTHRPTSPIRFPAVFDHEIDLLLQSLPHTNGHPSLPRFLLERLLIDAGGSIEAELAQQLGSGIRAQTEAARARLVAAGAPVP